MKVTITGRQLNVRNSLKEQIEKKLSKFNKFFDDDTEAIVTLSRKRNKENMEVTIYSGGTLFRSEIEDETFQNALDRVIETIEGQIRKNKTRLEKRLRQDAFAPGPEPEEDPWEEEDEFRIRTKTFSIKPMSVEEAILQMNLLGHTFFMFEDDQNGAHCVVYRRQDGDYGLIVPQ